MTIVDNYKTVVNNVTETAVRCGRKPDDITILAVSKVQSVDKMLALAGYGVRLFGESKVQEALPKINIVKNGFSDVSFHFIGKFQTNKAKKIVENFSLIHSVDRVDAMEAVSSAAINMGKVQDTLIQINLAGETQKNGVGLHELDSLLEFSRTCKGLKIVGFMMMPPLEENSERNRKYFRMSKNIYDKYLKIFTDMRILSMGMSGDYTVAIEEGATLLRIGSVIFGER